jgi:hypothetical protein
MRYIHNDGGRAAAGFKGSTGDCVCRAIAIASGRPYAEVHKRLAEGNGSQRMIKSNIRRYRRHGGEKAKPDKVSTARASGSGTTSARSDSIGRRR